MNSMLFHSFTIPMATTYGDKKDFVKRELIREAALVNFPQSSRDRATYWGFRIHVKKNPRPKKSFDLENVPKLIVDAFCVKQIQSRKTPSTFSQVGLYDDDTIDHVRMILVTGERTTGQSETLVEIHCWREGEVISF